MTSLQASPAYYRYRYLMGAMQQNLLTTTVRLMCITEEVARLDEIARAWRGASARMTLLATEETGLLDHIFATEPPMKIRSRLKEIEEDRLFQASFSALPTDFMVVEIDRLVAPQREVNLDYVDDLRKRVPGKSIEELVNFCVGPRAEPPDLKVLQTAQNQMTYTSRSLDLRFLGGYPKQITENDIAVAHAGGQPVDVIALLVGFGAAPINVLMAGGRLILVNGFHRVVAMRLEGITHIPVVVQHVAHPEIEFPDQFLGLSRAYLLQDPRPVLVKDFFDAALTIELRLRPRRKTVKISWGNEDGVIPE